MMVVSDQQRSERAGERMTESVGWNGIAVELGYMQAGSEWHANGVLGGSF